MKICPVIIAGGSGTRFWPLSRAALPKQFLRLTGDQSLIQQTLARVSGLAPADQCFIATGRRYLEKCREELPQLPGANLLGEPAARNTLPAITLAAVTIQRKFGPSIMMVLPADHFVARPGALTGALAAAAGLAESGQIVTLGITPTAPETGFGYIQGGDNLVGQAQAKKVAAFKEKPDLPTAQKYLAAGNYYWNAGIFVMSTRTFLDELSAQQPESAAIAQTWLAASDDDFPSLVENSWSQMTATSIDYGICEHSTNLAVIPVECGWSDVGSWPALKDLLPADGDGNIKQGAVYTLESQNNILFAENGHTIVTLGTNNEIIVATHDITLVIPKSEAQRVKDLLALVKNTNESLL